MYDDKNGTLSLILITFEEMPFLSLIIMHLLPKNK